MEQISLFKTSPDSFRDNPSRQKTVILSVLEDCHNYIYANEGILKEKAFREIIKILSAKIYIERHTENKKHLFKISKEEYKNIFLGKSCKNFENKIKNLYSLMSKKSSLKIWNEDSSLSLKTLAYIINRLQSIVFSENTFGDTSGQAFQTFIHRHQRGERGEFFTPVPVVELAVQIIQPKPNEMLIDPACGSGGFLLKAIEYIGKAISYKKLPHYTRKNIYGIEFNPDVALSSKLLLDLEGEGESNIICANALSKDDLHCQFDIALANPPFGRRGKVKDPAILEKYDLGKKWVCSNNKEWTVKKSILYNQPPEILFIEKCLNLLKPNGRMAIVVPDGILQNPSLGFVRHWIKSKACIIGIISLPPETFSPFGTGVKTSLMVLKKTFQRKNIFFSKIKNIGYDIKGNINYKNPTIGVDETQKIITNESSFLNQIESDINQVITGFFNNKKTYNKESSISWKLDCDFLKDRWDAEHYSLKDMDMIQKLDSGQKLSDFVKIVKSKENFSKSMTSIKYVAISDIDRHGMKIANCELLHTNQLPSRASYKILEGDILVAVSGANTGTKKQAIALVTKDYEGSVCSNGFAVLRNTKNINRYFLLAFFKTNIFTDQVRRMMTGHAIPYISLSDLEKIIVPVPDKKNQLKIGNKMKRIVRLAQIQHHEIKNLRDEKYFTQFN